MKTYQELTEIQQKKAIEHAYQALVAEVVEKTIVFKGEIGKNVDKALRVATMSDHPSAPYIEVARYAGKALMDLAVEIAEDSKYTNDGEQVIYEVA
jgi:23S rRNA-/tRNA-specific pseudouridylate synthase